VARRVILDTGVLIAFERGRLDVDTVLGLDDAAIAAITAMELLAGVERADTAHRQARAVRVEAILSSLPVEPYTIGIARVHARLAVAAMASGRPRSANDMMIAATAAATSRILLTTAASAGFDQLTGVRTELLKLP
jgi:tRNA(fMet)-specific endonuclease VapC